MEIRHARLYDGDKFQGCTVSQYGLDNGYIDYRCLAERIGNHILNNDLINKTFDWQMVNGFVSYDDNQNLDVYQWYIIDESGYDFLTEWLQSEIVMYNSQYDIYLWGVTHFGTAWDYVLTDIPIDKQENSDNE